MDFSHIRRGSTVLLHSSFSRVYREHGCSPEGFIGEFLEALGADGTLLLPLYNFDFCKGSPFNIRTTSSQMGALTEAGRVWPGAVRTGHPIYSFAAIGAKSSLFRRVDNRSGYGADS
ncbi:MAG: AAC(3) family N-acetyltransferase, partial [Prosthecobacter sp.]|nr:AAC(3) family N-acetyltransferase [Prosthecobacter sp.]